MILLPELSCSIAVRLLIELVPFAQIARSCEMCSSCCVRPSWFFLLFRKTRRCFLWLVRRLICRNVCQRAFIFSASVLTSAFLCVSRLLAFSSRQHKRNTSTKHQEENKNSRLYHVAWIVYRDSPSDNTWKARRTV